MKKYIFGSLLLAGGMLTACSLDETPQSAFAPEEAMKSETLIYVNTVAAVYNEMGATQNTTLNDASNFVSDEFMTQARGTDWYDGGVPQVKFLHLLGPSHGSQAGWSTIYTTIAKANTAIETLQQMNSESANNYIYELRAFRAMLYYTLCDNYGNVPLVTDASQSPSETSASPRKEIYKFCVTELTDCLPHLSSDMSQKTGVYYGRMTKAVAYMVLAKLALNSPIFQLDPSQANWAKDYLGNDMTNENKVSESIGANITAQIKANKLTIDGTEMDALTATIYCVDQIQKLGYKLAANYQDNFVPTNDNSPENIWTIPNDAVTYKRSYDHQRRSWHYSHASHPVYKGFSAWNGAAASTRLVRLYGYTEDRQDLSTVDPRFKYNFYVDRDYVEDTGARVDDGYNTSIDVKTSELALEYMPLWCYIDLGEAESVADIKKRQSSAKYYNGVSDNDFYYHVQKCAGARFKKYTFDYSTINLSYPGFDLVVFRYADAMMMRAEANYRLGNLPEALNDINEVRARVGLEGLTKVDLNVISDERQKELAWEGTRRQDQIRYATLNQPTIDRHVGTKGRDAENKFVPIDGHTYVWPIPADQAALNKNLKQPWGY